MRYRLRFLLQEFDLPRGATIIGRSLDCNLTIEDPLVSREHARITIDDDGPRLEDMRSRNGVRLNGSVVRGPTPLCDGDRVRIGTQDLIFCRVGLDERAHSKTTGVLRLCANCRLPYPREHLACPHCEATEQTDEVTLTDGSEENRAAWSVQLLLETLDRAIALGRIGDAERIVRRATTQVDEMLSSGRTIDARTMGAVADKVVAMTLATQDPAWALWVVDLYRRTSSVPSLQVADRLAEAALCHSMAVGSAVGNLLDLLQQSASFRSDDEIEAMARLSADPRRGSGSPAGW
ncbi:MAG: FHA domain-containing protein [Myxococcota bacterium]|nr:FHA domain-containing protein [Myxococcota bacterium]